ncbi:MAG: hypothetical protein WKG00_02265 [Polyangiaceae bacterium]
MRRSRTSPPSGTTTSARSTWVASTCSSETPPATTRDSFPRRGSTSATSAWPGPASRAATQSPTAGSAARAPRAVEEAPGDLGRHLAPVAEQHQLGLVSHRHARRYQLRVGQGGEVLGVGLPPSEVVQRRHGRTDGDGGPA